MLASMVLGAFFFFQLYFKWHFLHVTARQHNVLQCETCGAFSVLCKNADTQHFSSLHCTTHHTSVNEGNKQLFCVVSYGIFVCKLINTVPILPKTEADIFLWWAISDVWTSRECLLQTISEIAMKQIWWQKMCQRTESGEETDTWNKETERFWSMENNWPTIGVNPHLLLSCREIEAFLSMAASWGIKLWQVPC